MTLFFYADERINDRIITLTPGQFVVVFPEEVHRACYKVDNVEKIKKNSRENRHEFIIGGAGYDKNCPGDRGK
ncbi:YhcH/YjgK/YiaL family protein [Escherichia sp. E4385]|uniref:YhcH/YjgK/YiaL family protein n=1 Tax=Escherichia sp. E4385 TaxID=2040639 RepID=UPI001F0EBB10|nr:YhcH/YjgK/YiaL family protein [Escherichia sp. E4385]